MSRGSSESTGQPAGERSLFARSLGVAGDHLASVIGLAEPLLTVLRRWSSAVEETERPRASPGRR
jgi:hypothetical protein